MPRIANNMETHKLGGSFTFSGVRIESLGATEYTLVTIAIDTTGSVDGFENELRKALIDSVESCKKSPRSENLLVRVILFSTTFRNGLNEIHGFKPLTDIDTSAYPPLRPGGGTPLFDACYSAIGATNVYAKQLIDQDFSANGICFIITDGDDNSSAATTAMIKKEQAKAVSGETLESMISILIGINTANCQRFLDTFHQEANLSQFIDIGDASPRKLAKLAGFVSKSVSSQSQALGTGGPSQNIAPTI